MLATGVLLFALCLGAMMALSFAPGAAAAVPPELVFVCSPTSQAAVGMMLMALQPSDRKGTLVAGVLLCGLFLPYDQRFRLAHHNPAQWRAACRAFLWGLLWATCAAFFVALEFFLLAFVELGRTLLAETLLCLIGVACVFGAQHTPYVDEDLAVVLYVALAMGAWCFLISAIVWCYCNTSVGTEWGLTYGIKTIVGRDGATHHVTTCCGCICDPRRCRRSS